IAVIGGTLTINGGTIANNVAHANWKDGGGGGGIANGPGPTVPTQAVPVGTVELNGVTFTNNSVANGDGGAVYNRGALRVNGGVLSNNSALSGGGIGNGYAGVA